MNLASRSLVLISTLLIVAALPAAAQPAVGAVDGSQDPGPDDQDQ